MKLRLSGAALAAGLLLPVWAAQADNYVVKDGNGASQTFASKVASLVQHQLHIMEGLASGVPTTVTMTNPGALDVTITSSLPPGSATLGTVNLGSLSGAATAAKQPALGTAGSASLDVITVQGIASGTALKVDGSAVTQPISGNLTNISGTITLPTGASTETTLAETHGTKAAGTAATKSNLVGGVYTSAGITLTNGQQAALQFDSTGHLLTVGGGGAVTAASGAYAAGSLASGAAVDGWDLTQGAKADSAWTTGSGSVVALLKAIAGAAIDTTTPSPVKIDQTTVGTTNAVALAQIGANTVLTGNGTAGTGAQRVTVASDNTPFPVKTDQTTHGTTDLVAGDITKVAGTALTTGNGTTSAGSPRVTIASDNTAFAVNANLTAATTGGCTPGGFISTASTNSTSVKGSAGTFCGGVAINTTATLAYIRWYNASSAPTCSSATNYVMSTPVPASTAGAGTMLNFGTFGAAFTTGIAWCVTGGGSSTDNTNAVAGVYVNYTTK